MPCMTSNIFIDTGSGDGSSPHVQSLVTNTDLLLIGPRDLGQTAVQFEFQTKFVFNQNAFENVLQNDGHFVQGPFLITWIKINFTMHK